MPLKNYKLLVAEFLAMPVGIRRLSVKLSDSFLLTFKKFKGWKWWSRGPNSIFGLYLSCHASRRLSFKVISFYLGDAAAVTGKPWLSLWFRFLFLGSMMIKKIKKAKKRRNMDTMIVNNRVPKSFRSSMIILMDSTHPWDFPLNFWGLGLCPRAFTALPSPTILGYVTWLVNSNKISSSLVHMDVSKHRGGKPPKWMVKIMENPIKMDDLGVPLFLETPMPIHPFQLLPFLWLRN